jgi:hypothetical protein
MKNEYTNQQQSKRLHDAGIMVHEEIQTLCGIKELIRDKFCTVQFVETTAGNIDQLEIRITDLTGHWKTIFNEINQVGMLQLYVDAVIHIIQNIGTLR